MAAVDPEITALLQRSRTDRDARAKVYQLVYDDLRRLARYRIRASRPGETLSVTSLVNEAYLKLTERTAQQWNDRGHFLSVAARAMRQITIDYVRAKLTGKRGSGQAAVALDEMQIAAAQPSEIVLALDQGLRELEKTQPRLVDVVECRFFAGLTIAETAMALGISTATVERDWIQARQWLRGFLT